jgi:hypothetical protein
MVRSKILFYTGPHFSTCHPSLYCRLHVSVRPNDTAYFVHTNKYFAQSLSILENSAGGGLKLTTNWSITTGVLLREALLKRIRCHQTSSRVQICTECKRFRPTDPEFWGEGLEQVKRGQKYLRNVQTTTFGKGEAACTVLVEVIEEHLESTVLAWQN